jgi:DNA-binding CsgD family transcriptional regulator
MGSCHLWWALVSQPGAGVVVLDGASVIEFANPQAVDLWAPPGTSREDLQGRSIDDMFPAPVATERRRHVESVFAGDHVVVERVMWRGVRVQSTYRRVAGDEGEPDRVMVQSRRGVADPVDELEPAAVTFVRPAFADLGELEVLSPREVEVLAYLGRGLRIKEIAESMGRSPKTIQNHRESIGHKLRVTDRVLLAQIAREAGLEPGDAGLMRLSAMS